MKCFRLEVVGEEHVLPDGVEFNEISSTFLICRDTWQGILRTGNTAGTLATLNSQVEVTCGVCGSFMVRSEPFINFLQQTEAFGQGEENFSETVGDTLSDIYRSLIETKFNDEDAFWNYWWYGGGDHRLLKDENGDLVFDEFTGWPLGLAYDDVAVKMTSRPCSSCESFFQRD